ncbi:hypothetical protein Q4543_17600 [Salipiger sp. 1_MG-2023]|uniref:hypothetical protein n=1 Tax=Salipiger sp. 1_MG-2023 TaxID=3062665 RepID=UPI0026E3E3A0|nr:hypothetical protein [Salipiger sp. 1_MG-2023]MDO6587330.1 hypothetical protein [Salipiger sp. 1_MG-2023]
MRFLIVLGLVASPALAQETFAVGFNGYSVTVSSPNYSGQTAVDTAQPVADTACQSVGKSAVFQGRRAPQRGNAEFFFLCL